MPVPALSLQQVCKTFDRLQALQNVSFDIAEGEFFALLGPNGAGKTTLISILAGLTRATSGVAQVMGFDVIRDYREARRRLGVVPQELVFDPFFYRTRKPTPAIRLFRLKKQRRLDRRGDGPSRFKR